MNRSTAAHLFTYWLKQRICLEFSGSSPMEQKVMLEIETSTRQQSTRKTSMWCNVSLCIMPISTQETTNLQSISHMLGSVGPESREETVLSMLRSVRNYKLSFVSYSEICAYLETDIIIVNFCFLFQLGASRCCYGDQNDKDEEKDEDDVSSIVFNPLEDEWRDNANAKSMKDRLRSLDGGGVRGLIVVVMLIVIQKISKRTIQELFEVVSNSLLLLFRGWHFLTFFLPQRSREHRPVGLSLCVLAPKFLSKWSSFCSSTWKIKSSLTAESIHQNRSKDCCKSSSEKQREWAIWSIRRLLSRLLSQRRSNSSRYYSATLKARRRFFDQQNTVRREKCLRMKQGDLQVSLSERKSPWDPEKIANLKNAKEKMEISKKKNKISSWKFWKWKFSKFSNGNSQFSGTSAGGIIDLCIAVGKDLNQILSLFLSLKDVVFRDIRLYSTQALEELFEREFGDLKMKDLNKKVLVCAVSAYLLPMQLVKFWSYANPMSLVGSDKKNLIINF